MADERPHPGHAQDDAGSAPASVLKPVVADAPEAISLLADAEVREFVELVRLIESFRVCPERSGTFIVTKDKLAAEYLRVTHKIPTVGVIKVCEFVASQCRPMQASKAVEMALNRMYGAVAQRVQLEGDANAIRVIVEHRSVPLPELVAVEPEDEASAAS